MWAVWKVGGNPAEPICSKSFPSHCLCEAQQALIDWHWFLQSSYELFSSPLKLQTPIAFFLFQNMASQPQLPDFQGASHYLFWGSHMYVIKCDFLMLICLHLLVGSWVLSHVWLFATPWTVDCQVQLFMRFSKQDYRSGLPFPPPGDLPNLGSVPGSLYCLHWQADSLPLTATWRLYYFLLQGIFPTHGSNLGILHCRQILYHLNHHGSLLICFTSI